MTRFGPSRSSSIGLALITGGMIWYAQIPVDGSFASDLLPGYLMVGFGIAFAFIPVSIAALAGVEQHEAGLASGLINTSQQIGGAIGTAVASTIFTTHFKSLTSDGKSLPVALTGGYSWAFWGLAVFGVLALIAALTLVRREDMSEAPAAAPDRVARPSRSARPPRCRARMKSLSSPEICSARRVSRPGAASRNPPRFFSLVRASISTPSAVESMNSTSPRSTTSRSGPRRAASSRASRT